MTSPTAPTGAPETSAITSSLWKRRIVTLFGEISSPVAETCVKELLALGLNGREPITLLLHSPGGHVEAGDSIFDVIRFLEPEVRILGSGWVASAGALIYAAVPKERRFCLPQTRFMLHEPSGGIRGQATDVAIEVDQVLKMRERLNGIFAAATGQTLERIALDTRRNYWMSAEEAKAYGLVGSVVCQRDELFADLPGQ